MAKRPPLHERLPLKNYPKDYQINARKRYRTLMKKVDNFYIFHTVRKKENKIERITNEGVHFSTSVSKEPNFIEARKIKNALNYVFFNKTATHKDLEQFSNFNSALMGLIKLLLEDISIFIKTPTGLNRLTIRGCRFFFSGLDKSSEQDWRALIQNRIEFVLVNYYQMRDGNKWNNLKKIIEPLGIKVLMDCGAFSVFNQKEEIKQGKSKKKLEDIKDIDLDKYADFVVENKHLLYGFMNLDVIGDSEATQENYKALKERTGLSPIPIWHVNVDNWRESDWGLLDEIYQEDHPLIAIGATVGLGKKAGPSKQNSVKYEFFTEVFKRYPEQNFHWLGGSTALMFEFPFFSADSQGWNKGRTQKQTYTLESWEKSTRKGTDKISGDDCLNFNVSNLKSVENPKRELQLNLFYEYG